MNPALRNRLVAIVGVVAAAVLMKVVPSNEGTVYKTYRDIGGVLTYCTGATEDAIWGKTYTPNECAAKLDADLARHAEGVMGCVHVPLTDGQKVAFVDTAYNIGVDAFCSSGMARKANASDMAGACAALDDWACITVPDGKGDTTGVCANKRVNKRAVKGLINRRALAREYCEGRRPV